MKSTTRKKVFNIHVLVWRGLTIEVAMTVKRSSPLQQALLPAGKVPVRALSAALVAEVLLGAAILLAPLLFPQRVEMLLHQYNAMRIESAQPQPWKPRPPKETATIRAERVEAPPPEEALAPAPKIIVPVASSPVLNAAMRAADNTPPPEMVDSAKQVASADPPSSLATSAVPNLKRPRDEVQTGVLGDPSALPENGGARHRSASRLGGFGDGVVSNEEAGANRGEIEQGTFDEGRAASGASKLKTVADVTPRSTPIEVLFKPRPAYTDEARSRKIEGEVVLEVTFLASGEIGTLRVVRGLGFGLDESAEAAARQIRFKPAQRDGAAIDSVAVVHIAFELAY